MKKILLFLIVGLILVGIVGTIYAGVGFGERHDKLRIDDHKIQILSSLGIEGLNINESPMQCNDVECWSWVSQDNLINTEFRTPKSHCTDLENVKKQTERICLPSEQDQETCYYNYTVEECLQYEDYTPDELNQLRNDFVMGRINDYTNSVDERNNENIQQVDDGGIIS